jgi:hypothetical protein
MDPYRTPPPRGPEVEPELDRLPVALRLPVMRGGWIVVTPSALRFEPRFGRPREVPIGNGIEALKLSFAFDVETRLVRRQPTVAETIESWRHVAVSAPYQQPLAHARHRGIIAKAYAHTFGSGVYESRTFTPIIDGDRLLAIDAELFDVCFQLPGGLEIARSGAFLGRAVAWLGNAALAEMFGRLREKPHRKHCRVFSRQQVRDRPGYTVDNRRFELLGESSRDAIALEPTLAESMMLARWTAGEHVR